MRPTRLLTGLVSMALIALGLVVLLPDCASACSCSGPGWTDKDFDRALTNPGTNASKQLAYDVDWTLSHPGAVFSGKVVDVEKGSSSSLLVTLRVFEVWNGPQRETLEVRTASDGVICGYPFEEGQEYLVYAYGKEEPFKVDLCSYTKQLSKADAELTYLGKFGESEKPKGGEALTDTSGGFPPLEIIGMLGGAVAAVSLVVLMRVARTT